MKLFTLIIISIGLFISSLAKSSTGSFVRPQLDSSGYADTPVRMDSIMKRIMRYQGKLLTQALKNAKVDSTVEWKVAITPHDDYTYAGYIYPAVFNNLKAKTIFLIGVCHKAKNFGLQDKIIFDSYELWAAPYGPVEISPIRNLLKFDLDESMYVTHDSVQKVEHSLEALIPHLQYHNKDIKIVPILVPYMNFNRMNEISSQLAGQINDYASKNNWVWGKDYAILISNDAVHYGDQEWDGKNYSYYGTDSAGYKKAIKHEHEIIDKCLIKEVTTDKIKKFTKYTVQDNDYKEYKYTWCGRYSVPFGLLLAKHLADLQKIKIQGIYLGQSTSIANPPIPSADLGLGATAPANLHHWVGYVGIGYK